MQSGFRVAVPPRLTRRCFLQAGGVSVLGLTSSTLSALRSQASETVANRSPKSVIYIFLTGGPSQHDTFDMKPNAPAEIRGEFQPIATNTAGISICEHLPLLSQRSHLWSLVRSLSHREGGHDQGTYVMLTGRSVIPPTFRMNKPQPSDWPSIAAVANAVTSRRGIVPPAVVLPEKLFHSNAGIYPGQFAGLLGPQYEPWFIEATDKPHAYHSYSGAFPKYLYNLHKGCASDKDQWRFEVPDILPPQGVAESRMDKRLGLLGRVEQGSQRLDGGLRLAGYQRTRQNALDLMSDSQVRNALNARHADAKTLDRYGDNSFGWSLLMARRLVEAGANLVQVNLGNFGTWDLHGNNYPLLKDFLLPPSDRAIAGLLDDLDESGLLENTLVVVAGEFGRTPKISHIAPEIYKYAGRDHWPACQSILLAGGGVCGGAVIGASDREGAYPVSDMQTPENLAATIYHALGVPRTAEWHDQTGRPYSVYQADPIPRLMLDG